MYREVQSFFVILAFATLYLLTSCNNASMQGHIIITAVDNKDRVLEFKSPTYKGFLKSAKLLAIDPESETTSALLLTKDFYSACSPDISFDARKMVFAGQKSDNDTWQIYEMDLSSLRYKQLTNATENCTDPLYLPGENLYDS